MDEILLYIPRLIRASLAGDARRIESLSHTLARRLRKTHPEIAADIASTLVQHGVGANPLRSIGVEPPPADRDSRLPLVNIEEPDSLEPPVLRSSEAALIERFAHEWKLGDKLVSKGLKPPTSLLLTGAPGVGKTYTVRYLSYTLGLPMVVLDLSTAISSYLGKTGQNLRAVLDYARSQPLVLFLDEFDAIAKKRDDPADLGELKRIVNVLLKELETWPSAGILAAATNHPWLLDKAIWRRFDRVIEIGLPGKTERETLLVRHLDSEIPSGKSSVISALAELTDGLSAAEICMLTDRVLRRVVLDGLDPIKVAFEELAGMVGGSAAKNKGHFCRVIKATLGDRVSARDIASWLQISPSTVSHHLNRVEGEDKNAH